MEKILTAEEFIQDYWDVDCDFMESMREQLDNCSGFGFDNVPDLMAQFAKYHVEAALKAASENADIIPDPNGMDWDVVSKDSILKSYPLENIE
jgi:hypothetical protein